MFSLLALMAISLHHCPSRSVQKTYLFFFFSDLGFPKNSNLFCFFFIFWFLLFSFYFYFLWSYINRVFESTDPIFAITWRQMISVVKYLRIYFDCQSMSMKFLTTPNSGIDHINLWFFIYFAMLLHVVHSPSLSTSLILSLSLFLSLSLTHTHTKIGLIVGILGGLTGLFLCTIVLFFLWMQRLQARSFFRCCRFVILFCNTLI